MRSAAVVVVAVALGLPTPSHTGNSAQDAKDPHKGWVDYDDFKQAERLKERPGNYPVLAAIAEFFEGMYSVRPDYSRCAYPLQLDSRTYASWDELQKELDNRAKDGNRPKNKLRQFNVQIRSLSIHPAHAFSESTEYKKGLSGESQKRFDEVRRRHQGRAVVALIRADLESLQSSKVEGGEFICYLVSGKGRWQVAWFDK